MRKKLKPYLDDIMTVVTGHDSEKKSRTEYKNFGIFILIVVISMILLALVY
jgi:hypothetical protein